MTFIFGNVTLEPELGGVPAGLPLGGFLLPLRDSRGTRELAEDVPRSNDIFEIRLGRDGASCAFAR